MARKLNLMKQNYVYKITNLINLKIYIGVHYGEPDDTYMGSGVALRQAIKKYGIENFKKEIVDVLDSIEEAFKLESEIVNEEFINRQDTYNCMTGGLGGRKLSAETRRKMSEAGKGKKVSDESRKKISDSHHGMKASAETRRKMSEAQTGRKLSEETRRKMSETNTGRKLSLDHRQKISEGMLGLHLTEERKRRVSEGLKTYWANKRAIKNYIVDIVNTPC